MNELSTAVPGTVTPRQRLRVLPVVGGILACLALGSALIAGPDGTAAPTFTLIAAAFACLALEIGDRVRRLLRTPEAPLLGLVALTLVVVVLAATVFGVAPQAIAALFLATVGTSLAASGILRTRALTSATPTPWAALPGITDHDRSRLMLDSIGRILVGVALILIAISWHGPASALGVLVVAVVVYAHSHHTLTPTTDGSSPGGRLPDEVAAHLHDSVLQTLALIQRSANDPAKVVQLARQQEHSLRDWLAGRDGLGAPQTVASSLRAVAIEVEDETAGATIDVVTVGTTALDRRTEMLIQAAREAIRNAARHGSPKVRVFAETDPSGTRIFIRDTGAGFSIDQVPADRRGLRDAIIGRMDHVDGTVSIDSGDHGTEIELHLPARSR
jgi:hypothetical protein